MREFTLRPKYGKKSTDEMLDLYYRISRDMEQQFDWLAPRAYMPGISFNTPGVLRDFSRVENGKQSDFYKMSVYGCGTIDLSLTVCYTMLKLAGVDVSKYGLVETYTSVNDAGEIVVEEVEA